MTTHPQITITASLQRFLIPLTPIELGHLEFGECRIGGPEDVPVLLE